MAAFPKIMSGSVTCKYPTVRTVKRRTGVVRFCDGNEQRYAKGVPTVAFSLTYKRIRTQDKEILRIFFVERQGELDTTWTFAFDGTTYTHCRFKGRFEATEVAPRLWDVKLEFVGFVPL